MTKVVARDLTRGHEEDDRFFMQRALMLAEKGLGRTSPNPCVGAVLVRQGRIIGEGYHRGAGLPHAEIEAIRDAHRRGNRVSGATIFVTLEPCCHTGRTGPCTSAIIEAGISRVVYAIPDPDPRVRGKGGRRLRAAGISVAVGVGVEEARWLLASYLYASEKQTPHVSVKVATTLDGYLAMPSGESKWITGPIARRAGRRLRAAVDAVVVGARTARLDNPRLTTRIRGQRNPLRIIMLGADSLPLSLTMLRDNADRKTILAVSQSRAGECQRRYRRTGAQIWPIAATVGGSLSVPSLLDYAWREGIRSLLVEGGGSVIASFIRARKIQRWHQFIAPRLLGDGTPAVAPFGLKKLAKSPAIAVRQLHTLGRDIYLIGDLEYRA